MEEYETKFKSQWCNEAQLRKACKMGLNCLFLVIVGRSFIVCPWLSRYGSLLRENGSMLFDTDLLPIS